MDSELQQLMSRLSVVQRDNTSSVARKLNERNVVEIIAVLQRRGVLELVYTTDGREFLTWPQVRREVRDEVAARGGRMDVADLPTALNVDGSVIERAVADIIAEDPSVLIHEGELLTDSFFRSVAAQVSIALRDKGYEGIGDLSRSLRLSYSYTLSLLRDLAARGLLPTGAVLDDATLYTAQFVDIQLRRLCVALLGATCPVRVSDVAKRCAVYEPLLDTCIKRLNTVETKILPGRFDTAGTTYVPQSFEVARDAAVDSFYTTNGYIAYSMAAANGVVNPRQFLSERYNGAAATSSVVPSSSRGGGRRGRGGSKATTVASAASGASEAWPHFGYALAEGFVADRQLLIDVAPRVEALTSGEAMVVDLAETFPPCVTTSTDKHTLVARVLAVHPKLITDEADLVAGTVLLHRNAWGAVAKAVEGFAREKLGQRRAQPSHQLPPTSVDAGLQAIIKEHLRLHSAAGAEDALLQHILELWAERIEAVFDTVKAELQQRGHSDAKRLRERCATLGHKHWIALQLVQRALDALAASSADWGDTTLASIVHHCVMAHVAPLIKAAVVDAVAEVPDLCAKLAPHVEGDDGDAPARTTTAMPLSRFMALLPKELAAPFADVVKLTVGNSASAGPPVSQLKQLSRLLEELSSQNIIPFPLHGLNRKTERHELQLARERLALRALHSPIEPTGTAQAIADAFSALCEYGVMCRLGAPLPMPGRALHSAVDFLVRDGPGSMPAQDMRDAHRSVVDLLKAAADGHPALAEHRAKASEAVARLRVLPMLAGTTDDPRAE